MNAPLPTHFLRSVQQARIARITTDAATRGTIQTAHQAFGGHIGRGLLRRGRAAAERYHTANVRAMRREILLTIAELNPFWRTPADHWEKVNAILDRCHLAADLGDNDGGFSPYHSAAREWECYPKREALARFVKRYGGKRDQAFILPRLQFTAPTA